jgi:thioesterase domain-containing protein
LPTIEQANSRGWPIYLVGYSLGGDQARRLAEVCNEHGVKIRILFLLDPRYMADGIPGKIPRNVIRVVFYTSRSYDDAIAVVPTPYDLADAGQTALLVEDLPGTEHMGLPAYVTQRIQAEIAKDLQQAKALPPTPTPAASSVPLYRPVPMPLAARGG